MDLDLVGKTVLVTGGAGGIGQAISRTFAAEGANVIIHYHSSEKSAKKLATELNAHSIYADLRNSSEVEELFNKIKEEIGPLDICIANAGYYPETPKKLWEMDSERWSNTIKSNLDVTVNTVKQFLLQANKTQPTSIVMIGSTAGVFGEAGHSDYATAKGAITSGLLLSLKNEISGIFNCRINAVAPGWTATEKKLESGINDETKRRATTTMALKKLATPEDVANAVAVLSSNKISSHLTGEIITVAGGMEGRVID